MSEPEFSPATERYTAYTYDHICDCWEFDSETDSRWGLRPIIRHLREHYDDVSFLICSGTATEHGYLAREKDEVNHMLEEVRDEA